MDDALLVRVLDPAADADEELEPLAEIEAVPVAVVVIGIARHQLHHEVGEALIGGAGVERAGDVGVIHHRERLPLALEPGEHLAVSIPSRMTLSATVRRSGSSCSAS